MEIGVDMDRKDVIIGGKCQNHEISGKDMVHGANNEAKNEHQ